MTDATTLTFVFAQLLAQAPELLVCLGLCVWVLVRWRQVPASSVWALLGFGLLLIHALLNPGAQLASQRWVMAHGDDMARAGAVLTIYAAIGSAFRALAFLFLAAAIYTGRSAPTAAFPPPLPRPEPRAPAARLISSSSPPPSFPVFVFFVSFVVNSIRPCTSF